jgi:hypothetical protein
VGAIGSQNNSRNKSVGTRKASMTKQPSTLVERLSMEIQHPEDQRVSGATEIQWLSTEIRK